LENVCRRFKGEPIGSTGHGLGGSDGDAMSGGPPIAAVFGDRRERGDASV
jgi:hypothetical protein